MNMHPTHGGGGGGGGGGVEIFLVTSGDRNQDKLWLSNAEFTILSFKILL